MEIAATYICGVCGSRKEIFVDPDGGGLQEYIEDCAVCCRPHELRIIVRADEGTAEVVAEPC